MHLRERARTKGPPHNVIDWAMPASDQENSYEQCASGGTEIRA